MISTTFEYLNERRLTRTDLMIANELMISRIQLINYFDDQMIEHFQRLIECLHRLIEHFHYLIQRH